MPTYNCYDLTIDSDIDLPTLRAGAGAPDLTIRAGAVGADAVEGMRFRNWQAEPGRFLAYFPEAGRLLVEHGRVITYDRAAGADDSQIVSILLGTGLGAAMMQRRMLPLHSCSVATPKGALLVIGKSGAGKSTMLGGLLEHGLPMIGDDLTGLEIAEGGKPMAVPGFPAMRLWQDSLELVGAESDGLAQVRTDMSKYYLPVERFHTQREPIHAIAYLSASNRDKPEISELPVANRVEILSRFIFRKSFLKGLGLQRFAFEQVAATVRQVQMLQVVRPARAVPPAELAGQVLKAAGL